MDRVIFQVTLTVCCLAFGVKGETTGCVEKSLSGRNSLHISDSSYTASSSFDYRYVPHNAKLYGKYGWAPRYNSNPDDYLQIDLGTPRVITAVATQGNGSSIVYKNIYEWVISYKMNYSDDSSNWNSYKDDNGTHKIFEGNTDSNGVKRHDLSQNPITARYIRFVPVDFHKHKTIRVDMNISVFYQEAPVVSAIPQQRSIQLRWTIKQCNPADPITGFVISNGIKDPLCVSSSDKQYTLLGLKPYTEYNVRVLARTQRVNGSWSETTKIRTKEDAPSAPVNVTGTLIPAQYPLGPSVVITWDRPREPNGIIRKYTIVYYYNKDTSNNKTVTISGSADLTYSINVTKNGMLSYKISSTTVKEGPYAAGKDIEYGCPEQSLVGKERNLNLSDSSYTALSYYKNPSIPGDVRYKPHNAKLNGKYGWASSDNNNDDDYLQIDLDTPRVITSVATQGNGRTANREWVTKYKVYLATNNITLWYTYKDEFGNLKSFKGNTDSNSVVRHDLTDPQLARYIRFVPVAYHKHKTMRVNVYVTNQEPPRMEFIPNKRSINLIWTYEKCSPTDHITGYLVKVGNRTHKVIGDDLSYNVTDLKPYTEYNVSIKAIKQVGYGVWSNVTTIRTALAEPESIASLNATETSSETILLKWKLQNQSLIHGPLKGYRITYTPQEGKRNIIDVGDVGNYTLISLLKYTTYVITIAVRNTKYIGLPSTERRVRTLEDAPSAPVNVTGTLMPAQSSFGPRVVITWDKPRDLNGIIRKYTIVYYYNQATSNNKTVIINGTTDLIYVFNITGNGTFSYKISATTIKEGPYKSGDNITIPSLVEIAIVKINTKI